MHDLTVSVVAIVIGTSEFCLLEDLFLTDFHSSMQQYLFGGALIGFKITESWISILTFLRVF